MAIETLKAEVELIQGLKVECNTREFKLYLDQAEKAGGTNEGMCPGEALLSSLGGCKCMVAKILAESMEINLESLKLKLEGEIDPDGFTGKNKDAKVGFSRLTTKYFIKANNPENQIKSFIDNVENNCPIKDTIVNAPNMTIEINIQ